MFKKSILVQMQTLFKVLTIPCTYMLLFCYYWTQFYLGMQVDTSKWVILHRATLLIVFVDLPARAIVSKMKQFNWKSSCSVCLDEGTSRPGQPMLRYYPLNEDSVIITHQSMVNDASRAVEEVNAVFWCFLVHFFHFFYWARPVADFYRYYMINALVWLRR